MRVGTVVLVALLGASAWPLALAEAADGQGFFDAALPLALRGATVTRADNALVLAVGGGGAFAATLEAEAVRVIRTHATIVAVDDPVRGGAVYEHTFDPERTEASFGPSSVAFDRVGAEGTLFAYPGGRAAYVVEATGGASALAVAAAPRSELATNDPTVVVGEEDAHDLALRYVHDEPHFRVAADGLSFVVAGDFALFLWDADFTVAPEGGNAASFTTGHHRDRSQVARTEEVANAVLVVTGGALTIEGALRSEVYAPTLATAVDGQLLLPQAVGGFVAGEDRYEANGVDVELSGHVLLELKLLHSRFDRALVAVSGRVDDLTLAPVATLDRHAFLGMAPATAAAAAAGGALLAAGAVLLVRRRDAVRAVLVRPRAGRADEGDDFTAGVYALDRGDAPRAALLLERAARSRPEDVDVLVDWGAALEREGRLPEAREAYERAVRLAPSRAETHYYYSRALANLGLTASALPHLQRALVLDPRLAEMARGDRGFRALGDHPTFLALVG